MVTILSGSPRKNSNTLRVAKAIKEHFKQVNPQKPCEIIDFYEYDVPNYNQTPVDVNQLSPWQQKVVDAMSNSQLVFVLTPEYNWMPSAEMLQFIHVFGAPKYKAIWENKVFATCGTSSGRGGRMPAVQLSNTINKVLNVFNFESFVSAKMFESQFTDKALDENGLSLGNEEYNKGLQSFIDYNLKVTERWH
jgi:chromate reductase